MAGESDREVVIPERRVASPQRWTKIERALRQKYGELLAGVDEVGRGPLAGPVVACAVIMPPNDRAIAGVDDSKLLPAAVRERLAGRILSRAIAVSLGAASVREIDRFNIYRASILAMHRAIGRLRVAPQHVVIDGNRIAHFTYPHTAVVGGDARCYTVACASIVAKVTRDRLMTRLARRYPAFGWDHNAGYATPDHVAALEAGAPTRHHRGSFTRVRQLLLGFEDSAEIPLPDVAETSKPGAYLPLESPAISPWTLEKH
ncbi:MAG TPA: ribonuclease HII [Gemmatimonadaceae bacterium]|jgi:ribonuclease HII|nr:ribonuclease HII [Gemmatimonadaceae bacterium]